MFPITPSLKNLVLQAQEERSDGLVYHAKSVDEVHDLLYNEMDLLRYTDYLIYKDTADGYCAIGVYLGKAFQFSIAVSKSC